jgi:hypothetical protein
MAHFDDVRLWWSRLTTGYRAPMSRESESPRSVAALPRPEGLDRFEGMWVAVADGNVVAAAESSHQLALRLHDMDHRKRRQVVIEYVRPTTDSYIVGAG